MIYFRLIKDVIMRDMVQGASAAVIGSAPDKICFQDPAPTGSREFAHHAAAVASARSGFDLTPHGFTGEADEYAATAPVKLVGSWAYYCDV
jgi:hypothetical protein